jgi:hypothetical protein
MRTGDLGQIDDEVCMCAMNLLTLLQVFVGVARLLSWDVDDSFVCPVVPQCA